MRIRRAIRERIASTAARVVLVAGGALVGWLLVGLFAGPAQAAPEAEGTGADSGGLLGLVPEPAADLVEQVAEPVAQVAEPVARVTEPVERVTESVTKVTEPVEQVTESVAQVTEPVTRVVEPVTRVVEQTTTTVVDPLTEILADPPAVAPLVEAAPELVGPIAESATTEVRLPAVLPPAPAAGTVTAAEPMTAAESLLTAGTVTAGPAAATPSGLRLVGVGPPAWWTGSPPEQARSPDVRASPGRSRPAQDRYPGRPPPMPGPGTSQLGGSPTDPGQPLAWTGPATAEPSADPVHLPISGDVAGSGLALPVSPPPG